MNAITSRPVPPSQDVRTIPGTDLVYDMADLSDDGRLSLLLAVDSQRGLDDLRRQVQQDPSARLTPLSDPVPSPLASIPVDEAPGFVHSLPSTTRVFVDTNIDFNDDDPLPGTRLANAPSKGSRWPEDVDRRVMGLEQVWKQGYTGKGVTAAVIDSGLFLHPDIKHAYKGFVDIAYYKTEPYDAYGHGTQVAGLIAGDGARSHHHIVGAAPDASVVGVRITTVDEAIAGLRWVIANQAKYGIRVINMSLGETATTPWQKDVWAQACEDAIKAGLIVVVAAGDEGPSGNTIDTPGYDPNVITVGALDDHQTVDKSKHTVYDSSSRGPTFDGLHKPDILAPGAKVWGPLVPGSKKDQADVPHLGNDYVALSGSSQATGLVTGFICDMLQANPNLTQPQVLHILRQTARHYLQADVDAQGAGVVDAPGALRAALALKKSSSGVR